MQYSLKADSGIHRSNTCNLYFPLIYISFLSHKKKMQILVQLLFIEIFDTEQNYLCHLNVQTKMYYFNSCKEKEGISITLSKWSYLNTYDIIYMEHLNK